MLLTVALVAYLVLFNVSLCSRWDCCDSLGNLTKINDTLRWGAAHCQGPSPAGRLDCGPSWHLRFASGSFQSQGLRARGPSGLDSCGWAACFPLDRRRVTGSPPGSAALSAERDSWAGPPGDSPVFRPVQGWGRGAFSSSPAPCFEQCPDPSSSGENSCLWPGPGQAGDPVACEGLVCAWFWGLGPHVD